MRWLIVAFISALAGCGKDEPQTRQRAADDAGADTSANIDAGPSDLSEDADDMSGEDADNADLGDDSGDGGIGPATLNWLPCDDRFDCALMQAPIDYDDPSRGTLEIGLVRRQALIPDQRIGTLVVIPGSGGLGAGIVARLNNTPILGGQVMRYFDVIGMDVRNHGASVPNIDCPSGDLTDTLRELHPLTDDPQVIADTLEQMHTACEDDAVLLSQVDSRSQAFDIDRLREALGEEQITLWGASYGPFRIAVYATLFPERVRAMALVAPLNASQDPIEAGRFRAEGMETALEAFLTWCEGAALCQFNPTDGSDVRDAFDAFVQSLAAAPPVVNGRRLTIGIAVTGIAAILSAGDFRLLSQALTEAAAGDGFLLLREADELAGRFDDGTYGIASARAANGALDKPHALGTTAAQWAEDVATSIEPMYPRIGHLYTASANELVRASWPYRPTVPVPEIDAQGAPPALLVSQDADPLTGRPGAINMRDALNNGSYLLESRRIGHFAHLDGCARDRIQTYYLNPTTPPDLTPCPGAPILDETVLGELTAEIVRDPDANASEETALGNLVADGIRASVGPTALAAVNHGGIRTGVPSGYMPMDTSLRRPAAGYAPGPPFDIVGDDIEDLLPFGNRVAVLEVTGAQVWDFLEAAIDDWAPGQRTGGFVQISGMRFEFSQSAPAFARVVSVTTQAGDPILNDSSSTYMLAIPDYVYDGWSGYLGFLETPADLHELMADAVRAHVQTLGVVTPMVDGRITVLP